MRFRFRQAASFTSAGIFSSTILHRSDIDQSLAQIDPSTLKFSGAAVAASKKGKWQLTYADINGDGHNDVIAHFEMAQLLLGTGDTQGVIEGRTLDNRLFRGSDSVRVIK